MHTIIKHYHHIMVHKIVTGLGLFCAVLYSGILFPTAPYVNFKYDRRQETELDRILREHKNNKR